MDSSISESSAQGGTKRKRTPSAEDSGRASAPPPAPVPAMLAINYLAKEKAERLRLIEGDSAAFANILAQIEEYEGMFVFLITWQGLLKK